MSLFLNKYLLNDYPYNSTKNHQETESTSIKKIKKLFFNACQNTRVQMANLMP